MNVTFPQWWLPVVQQFLQSLVPLFQLGPLSVTSFARTRSHNAAVGGAPSSQHLLGLAVDLVPLDGDMAGLEEAARSFGYGYVLNEGDHVHIQAYPAGQIPDWIYQSVTTA